MNNSDTAMNNFPQPRASQALGIISHYPDTCRGESITHLGGAGGFSGATFWRLSTQLGTLCLRRWPPDKPAPKRLKFIHDVLRHAQSRGFTTIPVPLPTRDGSSFVVGFGTLWELSPWLPGEADYHRHPSQRRLQNAMLALADFHGAVAEFPIQARQTPSPSIRQRQRQLAHLIKGEITQITKAMEEKNTIWPELSELGTEFVRMFHQVSAHELAQLEKASTWPMRLQPCIRDIWHDHVLYENEQVTGLIDFGAMRVDSVATDIARLTGSMVGEDKEGWRVAVEAYSSRKLLSPRQCDLIQVFDESTTLLSGINWLDWIFRENRQFEQRDIILQRFEKGLGRLRRLRDRLAL